jgi:hypothetical protein
MKPNIKNGEPTEVQLADVCMWYRHDFGLLSDEEKKRLMFEAKERLRAWRKAFNLLR